MIYITLYDLPIDRKGIIKKLNLNGNMRRRLLDLGFIPDTEIECILKAPSNGPILYRLRNTLYGLRTEEAKQIDIVLAPSPSGFEFLYSYYSLNNRKG